MNLEPYDYDLIMYKTRDLRALLTNRLIYNTGDAVIGPLYFYMNGLPGSQLCINLTEAIKAN
jgi:hypothetical protein